MIAKRTIADNPIAMPYKPRTAHDRSLSLFACLIMVATTQADWPQYLGPDRNATAPDFRLSRSWPDGGPRKLWSFPLGPGYGGASVHDGEVFILDRTVNHRDILRGIDLETGLEKWSYAYPAPGRHPYPGSRGVPTVDDDHVWTVGPFGHFHCIGRKTHVPVWSVHLLDEFTADDPRWGVSQSPLLYRDAVIVAPQGKKGGVVAFDKKTGALRWASRPLMGIPGYVSPIRLTIGGQDQIVMISARDRNDKSIQGEVVAFDPLDGQPLWSYRDFDSFVAIAPPAVVGDGRLFLSNSSRGGHWDPISIMLEVKRKGDGFTVSERFRTGKAAGKMHPPVVHDGYLYFNDLTRGIHCLSLDGELMWAGGPNFQLGAFVLADGLILNQDGNNGDLYLIEPSPDGYRELARARLFPDQTGHPWAPLALSDGKLLIRDGKQMVCVDVENPR